MSENPNETTQDEASSTAENAEPKPATNAPEKPAKRKRKPIWFRVLRGVALFYLIALVLKPFHPADLLFFFPERDTELSAPASGPKATEFWATTPDGEKLNMWFLETIEGESRTAPTVVHFHGNAYNMSRHVDLVDWLCFHGYNVLLFDYRGYGKSSGSPTRAGLQTDGLTVLDWARSQDFIASDKLIVLGQSLGGAISMDTLGTDSQEGVLGLALDATFDDYRYLGNLKCGGTFISEPVTWALISKGHDPRDSFPKLRSFPVLVIHGDADQLVPYELGPKIAAGIGENARFVSISGADHVMALARSDGRQALLEWLDEVKS